ncbi:TIGR03936 family radical SAM-associated protein [Anaerolineales bacterium HSG6]|nr:TIGR03936 family radical SAM-associated protein [Anaerolineales bacterium HSG6]MDM8532344.1 TIGR03936 family radical SAM-associated protein [Anaerolineales bacterium HSG25]
MTEQLPVRHRLRLIFAKKQAVKYIGHLDLMLAWERALRRARIPLAYSQGFNPRPKMQVASSLPLGTTGTAERLDIIVTEALNLDEIKIRIQQALPVGLGLVSITEVPLKSPALQQLLRQADYTINLETALSTADISRQIEHVMAQDELLQTRRRRKREEQVNIRPWLYQLNVVNAQDGEATITMRVANGQHGNLRPKEVMTTLGFAENWFTVERNELIFEP